MGKMTPIKKFSQFREAVAAYRLPRIILTALDLDLFTVMGSRAWTILVLATRLRVDPRALHILCRNLASAGFLIQKGNTYVACPVGQGELNRQSPKYRGAYVELIKRQWDDWSQLTRTVKRGTPVDRDAPDHPQYRRHFSWAMHHRSQDVAPLLAKQLNLAGAATLLDLGGGPGTFALAFLAKNPALHATLCDRPPAVHVARLIAKSFKHGRRLSYYPLDFMQKTLKGRYDVIWLSNVVHIYSPEENQALFRRLVHNLTPRGRLIIQDAFTLDPEGFYPSETNLFAVTMLLFTEAGNTYARADVMQWLRKAGLKQITPIRVQQGAEDWEGGLLEARVAKPK